ncbi:HNH endonuclease [Streptomyces sp. NPDC012888]|uniref:HNH endonuclease n=1 Tax=Streptomyces sp. NPDC012888 TaxID=3364855 RepID=UPI00367A5CA2
MYWLIRGYDQGAKRYAVPEWLAGGYAAVSWREAPEIAPGMTEREACDVITAAVPGLPRETAVRWAWGIQRFLDVVSVGDVMVAAKAPYDVHVGVVTGPAYYDPPPGLSFPRRRAVRWLTAEGDEPYHDLPSDIRAGLTARQTLTELPPVAAEYFARHARAEVAEVNAYRRLCEAIEATEPENRDRTVTRPAGLDRYRDPRAVRAVLDRCGGRCENPVCGGMPADVTADGEPILDVDHVDDHAKGGRDHPAAMIALCPNCHAMKTRGSRAELLRELFRQTAATAHASRLSR